VRVCLTETNAVGLPSSASDASSLGQNLSLTPLPPPVIRDVQANMFLFLVLCFRILIIKLLMSFVRCEGEKYTAPPIGFRIINNFEVDTDFYFSMTRIISYSGNRLYYVIRFICLFQKTVCPGDFGPRTPILSSWSSRRNSISASICVGPGE